MRTVHECGNNTEAEILKGYLEGFGIMATYDGADSIGFTGRYRALRGVGLKVPVAQAEEARRIIAEADFSADVAEDDEGGDDWREAYARERETPTTSRRSQPAACPNCGSANIHADGLPRWLNLVLLGLPALFARETWACADCGWSWNR